VAPEPMYRTFVSYGRHDEALIKPLVGLLSSVASEPIFLDVTSLEPGDLWRARIEEAIKQCDVFIICWCCASKASRNVAQEIRAALEDKRKKIVPVLLCEQPVPAPLSDCNWVDLRGRVIHQCEGDHESAANNVTNFLTKDQLLANPGLSLSPYALVGPPGFLDFAITALSAYMRFRYGQGNVRSTAIAKRLALYFLDLGK
jgi:hypothetical protein